jgi:IS605 OrfB family transposase
MIKSTKTSLKFSNKNKLENINSFIQEYKRILKLFVDILWDLEKVPTLIPKEYTSKIDTWLSARIIQCCGKQASGIVRGTKIKQKRRLFIINKLKEEKKFKKARKLQKIYDDCKVSKPKINDIQVELDERFVKIDLDNKTSFDGWITLTSIGNKLKLVVPFKKTKHFNKILNNGNIKKGIRLSNKEITFMFEIEDVKPKENGKTLGIDIGQKTTLSCSDNQSIDKCPHNHDYNSICQKLSRKQKGSKGFNKTVKHRSNYLRYIVNKLNLDNVKVVNRENIKHLRKFSNVSRKLKHWNYKELFDVLDNKLIEKGVLINKLNPTYTSQRCSCCGWTRKSNRKKKKFKCDKCSHEQDSDLNASINLSLDLEPISYKKRHKHNNKKGFYWNVCGQKPIVSVVREINFNGIS